MVRSEERFKGAFIVHANDASARTGTVIIGRWKDNCNSEAYRKYSLTVRLTSHTICASKCFQCRREPPITTSRAHHERITRPKGDQLKDDSEFSTNKHAQPLRFTHQPVFFPPFSVCRSVGD